jgi:hypothetical protein
MLSECKAAHGGLASASRVLAIWGGAEFFVDFLEDQLNFRVSDDEF